MKTHLLCLSIIFLFSTAVSAQAVDKSVEKIRTLYSDIAEKARLAEADDDRGSTGELVMNELVINKRDHQWRAVGIYRQIYKFFYQGGNSEEHLYPDQLVLVKAERRVSDRIYMEEYLFSETGVLLYCIQKAENDKTVPAERKVYFSGPIPLRVIEDGKTRDRLAIKNTAWIKELAAESGKLKELFQRSIKL